MTASTERIVLYAADGTPVHAILLIENIYSQPTLEGKPGELILQMATCQLENGTRLNRVDENIFETPTGQRLNRIKPA